MTDLYNCHLCGTKAESLTDHVCDDCLELACREQELSAEVELMDKIINDTRVIDGG